MKYGAQILLLLVPFLANYAFAASITVAPLNITQGDPLMVSIQTTSTIKQILFDGIRAPSFSYNGTPHALIGIDILKKPGDYPLTIQLNNGGREIKIITVNPREKLEAPLGIPQKLGGNTPQAQKNLVTNLSKENATLAYIKTGAKVFWKSPFIFPVKHPIVTDTYGYNRKTGEYTIAHKGTDFHADIGTPVFAMNRGVVRIAKKYTVYGKTIVVDHGLGVHTLYMHLSKIKVNEGELVQQGQVIGLSGDTGYAEKPHLHVSIKIQNISIDPIVFLNLFGQSVSSSLVAP